MSLVGAGLGLAAGLMGCRSRSYVAPEQPMPANTILLSQMMRELSAQPGFNQELVDAIDPGKTPQNPKAKRGPALLTPELVDELRKRLLGQDWSGLDRFPGWTMHRITPTVRVVGHVAGKDATLEADSAVKPGEKPAGKHAWLDVGPYALDQEQTISLDGPSPLPGFEIAGQVTELGHGVSRGDGPNEFAPEHAESQWIADVLNRLAANEVANTAQARVSRSFCEASASCSEPRPPAGVVDKPIMFWTTPEQVIRNLQWTGHTVTVIDARYFANFAHMHFMEGGANEDVMAPFWIDTGIEVPGAGSRHLLVPVSHAELEWQIRGPKVNADISWYYGVDGKAQWRVMDTLDQPWVLKRAAHTYTGKDTIEATRLAGVATMGYLHLHEQHAAIPFGGYFAFGVCQDAVSAVEKKLTGKVTLFPNTADESLFDDGRDAEFNAMMRDVPKDREAKRAEPERIFGSLPAAPDASGRFSAITVPGLADDLNASYAAWKAGTLGRRRNLIAGIEAGLAFGLAVGVGVYFAVKTRRMMDRFAGQQMRR